MNLRYMYNIGIYIVYINGLWAVGPSCYCYTMKIQFLIFPAPLTHSPETVPMGWQADYPGTMKVLSPSKLSLVDCNAQVTFRFLVSLYAAVSSRICSSNGGNLLHSLPLLKSSKPSVALSRACTRPSNPVQSPSKGVSAAASSHVGLLNLASNPITGILNIHPSSSSISLRL